MDWENAECTSGLVNAGDIEPGKGFGDPVAMNSDLHISIPSMVLPIYSLPVNEVAVSRTVSGIMVPSSPPLLLLLPLTLADYGPEHPWEHSPYGHSSLYDYPEQLQSDEYYYNYFPNNTYSNSLTSIGGQAPIRRTIGSLVDDVDISAQIGMPSICKLNNSNPYQVSL